MLQTLVVSQVYAFMLVFIRIGTAMMIMPGTGDGFVPARVRLLFALGFSVLMTPVLSPYLPEFSRPGIGWLALVLGEFAMGAFIGGVARIFMTALDTAGMFISMQMGLANAQIFNPASSAQGSIMGAFLSIFGTVLLFVTNLHHLLIMALVDSYQTFPPGGIMMSMSGDFANIVSMSVTRAFAIGFQFAVPFIVVTTMIYVSMGILARLMPQLQVFILSMPIQISVGLILFTIVLATGMTYWMGAYETALQMFVVPIGAR